MQLKHLFLVSTAAISLVSCDNQSNLSDGQKKEVETVVRTVVKDILEKEPEQFISAIDKGMQNQQRRMAQKIEQMATESQKEFWGAKLVIGNKDAELKLAVFFDPLDPVSQKFNIDVMEKIVKERSDVGFFLIPVSIYGTQEGSEGPSSLMAAHALIAASWQNQDLAVALWSKMPNINKELPRTKLLQMASDVGINDARLGRDIDSEAAHEELINNGKLALRIGIPLQLPVIFVRKKDGILELMPPFVKEKLNIALDALKNDKSWMEALDLEQKKDETSPVEPKAVEAKEK